MKKFFCIVCILFCLFQGASLFAQSASSGFSAIFTSKLIDLRAVSQLPSRSGNQPGPGFSMEDLEIGSIFLTVDNQARKVVDIYEHNGRTIIETIEPRPEEVFIALHVPEFKQELSRENIVVSSLADGVSLLPPGAGKADMLCSDFEKPSDLDKSVTWLETDAWCDGKNISTFNIDIPLYKKSVSKDELKKLRKKEEDAKEKDRKKKENQQQESEDGFSSEAGGKPETDWGIEGEVRLIGTLRLAQPEVKGGLDMPEMKFSWVSKWWGGYFKISFEDGYAMAGFTSAQQFDFKLVGTVSLTSEVKVPLFAIAYKKAGVELAIGFYAKISLDGKISLAVECSEYSTHDVTAKCKLVWPFFPVKFSGDSDSYINFGYRPTVSAEAELKTGLYLGADLEVEGIGIAEAEAGGGNYILIQGFMEPMGIMGYDTRIGQYGDFNDWILDLYAEAGLYAEVTAEIIDIDMTLWERRWPYWEWHEDWEL